MARGRVHDLDSLAAFLRGRLATAGMVDTALAAAACARAGHVGDEVAWAELVVEAEARQPSPALRAAWRVQGRALLRVARHAWPGPVLDGLARALPDGAPHPLVLGACAAAAGLGPGAAAALAAHHSVTGPASAAVRLLGLDPLAVAGVLAGLATEIDLVAPRGGRHRRRAGG